MAINYEKLVNWQIPEVEQRLTRRDTILYALGVGLGADPCDADQLRFVYEEGLLALPTTAIFLCYPGPWHAHPDTGITRSHVLHGEQGFRILKPLPVKGNVVGKTRITGVVDKGKDKGALVMTECTVRDKTSGEVICTQTSTAFCRADRGSKSDAARGGRHGGGMTIERSLDVRWLEPPEPFERIVAALEQLPADWRTAGENPPRASAALSLAHPRGLQTQHALRLRRLFRDSDQALRLVLLSVCGLPKQRFFAHCCRAPTLIRPAREPGSW